MNSIFERLRSRRLASTFVVLATLSAAIVFGSYLAPRGTRAGEAKRQRRCHSAARDEFNGSAQRVREDCEGSGAGGGEYQHRDAAQAVEHKSAATHMRGSSTRTPAAATTTRTATRGKDRARTKGQGRTIFRISSTAFLAARCPTRTAAMTDRCVNRWVRASSSTPRATSSPTIT